MIEARLLIERHVDRFGFYVCQIDLSLSPDVERAFVLDSQCLGTIYCVIDDFGDLVQVDPWRPLSFFQQRH